MKLQLGYCEKSPKLLYTSKITSIAIVPAHSYAWIVYQRFPLFQTFRKAFQKAESMWTIFWHKLLSWTFPMSTARGDQCNGLPSRIYARKKSLLWLQKSKLPCDNSLAYLFVNHHILLLVLPSWSVCGILMWTMRLLATPREVWNPMSQYLPLFTQTLL